MYRTDAQLRMHNHTSYVTNGRRNADRALCSECGSNRFRYPYELKDDAVITCEDCGREVGTVADLQRKVVEQASRQRTRPT